VVENALAFVLDYIVIALLACKSADRAM